MKFGKVENPEMYAHGLPKDHTDTKIALATEDTQSPKVFVGCPRWAKAELKGFYPKGVKDELSYYSSQFNAIELNAYYYRIFPPSVVERWYDRSSPNFMFFPKVPQLISQFRRLKNCDDALNDFFVSISHFKEKLGTVFLQMNDNYGPYNFQDLALFVNNWPKDLPLSVELRNSGWYSDSYVADDLCAMLQENRVAHTITDTLGRRDLMHMRLTNSSCFVRFTGANHSSDITRIDEWYDRLTVWKNQGINQINFFVHQTIEKDLQMLSARLINKINEGWGYNLNVPGSSQTSLF
ncbi:MAG: DUF72 domain-containing protein [Bacteroidia bacterium]|nr:DUF72 domain-containing protein [Bacteroidia bacterium]